MKPIDKERAIEVAHKHLIRRLGKKIPNLRNLLEAEADLIGVDIMTTDIEFVAQSPVDILPTAKRHHHRS